MTSRCAACGDEMDAAARFCPSCGAPTTTATHAASTETRKTVTVLFADISGSTALGERLDPEAVRALLARYFAEARTILERHGGTVEKFIGDAVMAVFGVPTVHEDDALRAVRAALELQDSVSAINDDGAATARLAIRIGINTGEVVSGIAGETLVTGDAVNTAARLEQAADPGDVLIGLATHELVRDAVDATPVDPIEARGKSTPVPALRVRAITGDEGRRRAATGSLVGREAELAALRAAWDARADRAQLVTVIAPAGVGKSRLIAEMAAALNGHATVAKGRCLSYGDGITYWPMREIVHQLAGIVDGDSPADARAKLNALIPGQAEIAGPVAAAIGLEAQAVHKEDLFWALRRLFEAVGDAGPLLLLVEDLHWAEETMLDLIEYLAEMTISPLMVLATARPDLLVTRPAWSSATGTMLRLEALGPDASEELLLSQSGADALPPVVRQRILEAADGNALFLEELVAMLRDRSALRRDGDGWTLMAPLDDLEIPPSIQALLAARLDQLAPEERSVAQHGAVIGRSFEAAAVAEIAPDTLRSDLTRRLLALVRKELLRPDRPELTDGDAFRFRHILIRDAAYAALSKGERALLHELVAGWLERAAGERIGEFEEIVAHHLEQAIAFRRELGESDLGALSDRAARRMLAAAERAANRDDSEAAISLFRKAAILGRGTYEVESVALRQLGEVLQDSGAFTETEQVIDRALEIAEAAGNEVDAATARLNRLYVHRHTEPATWVAEADVVVPEAIAVFERTGSVAGLASAWHARGLAAWPDHDAMIHAEEQGLVYARASGAQRWLGWIITSLASVVVNGATPVSEGVDALAAASEDIAGLGRLFTARVGLDRAVLEAMRGRHDQAREQADAALEVFRQFGHRMELALSAMPLTLIHIFADEPRRAEEPLREAIEFLETTGDQDLVPYLCAMLALCVAMDGRYDEARILLERADAAHADAARDRIRNGVLARILAAEGEFHAAIAAGEEAVRISPEGAPTRRALAFMDLAHALAVAGRTDEARAALGEATRLTDLKGNVALGAVIARQASGLGEDRVAGEGRMSPDELTRWMDGLRHGASD